MIYLDTGCLVKLYYPEQESKDVAAKTAGLPIVLTSLHRLELTTAMRLKVFRQEATEDQVRTVLQFVGDDVASGKLISIESLSRTTIKVAIGLANQYSATTGCRSLDTLHCALAQSLALASFITTDARQLLLWPN